MDSNIIDKAAELTKEKKFTESIEYMKSEIPNINLDELKANVFKEILTNYYYLGDKESAITFSEKELEIREALGENEALANAYNSRGVLAHLSGDLKTGQRNYHQALDLAEKLELEDKIIDGFSYAIANLSQHMVGDHEKAITYYKKGLEISEKSENKERMTFYLDHLVMANLSLKNLEEAKKYLDIADEFDYNEPTSHLFHHMEKIYFFAEIKNYTGVMNTLINLLVTKPESLENYNEIPDFCYVYLQVAELISQSNIMGNLTDKDRYIIKGVLGGDLKDVEYYFDKALELAKGTPSNLSTIRIKQSYAEYLVNVGNDRSKASEYLNEVYLLANQQVRNPEIINIEKLAIELDIILA